jgi:anti-anti-sigma factor
MESASPDRVLNVSTRHEGDGAVIELDGELDLHESNRLSALISDVLTDPVVFVELDARRLTFIDSGGVRTMLVARADAESRGITLRLSGVSPTVRRIMEIAGAEELLPGGDEK